MKETLHLIKFCFLWNLRKNVIKTQIKKCFNDLGTIALYIANLFILPFLILYSISLLVIEIFLYIFVDWWWCPIFRKEEVKIFKSKKNG